jgi:hypothetical protein
LAELQALGTFPEDTPLGSDGRAGGRFDLLAGALAGCFKVPLRWLSVRPCLLADLDIVISQGDGAFLRPASHTSLAPSLGAALALSRPMTRNLAIELRVVGLAPIAPLSFVALDPSGRPAGVLYDQPTLLARLLLGLRLAIP